MTIFRRNKLMPIYAAVAIALSGVMLSACEEEGPAEEAGEAIDEAASDAERAVEDATD